MSSKILLEYATIVKASITYGLRRISRPTQPGIDTGWLDLLLLESSHWVHLYSFTALMNSFRDSGGC